MSELSYKVLSDLSLEYASEVLALYNQVWWTKGRNLASTKTVMKGSTCCFGLFGNDGHLVGFARILSDCIEKATIYDVIIEQKYQGQGLGILMIDAILKSPYCEGVKHVELYCKEEMIPFYERMGFVNITDQVKLLRWTSD